MLKFLDCQCIIDVSFWDRIARLKLEEWKLETPEIELRGFLQAPNVLRVDEHSIGDAAHACALSDGPFVRGRFCHVNSYEEFCDLRFNDIALGSLQPLLRAVRTHSVAVDLICPFLIVAYMDLKNYVMRYAVSVGTVGDDKFEIICTEPSSPVAFKHSEIYRGTDTLPVIYDVSNCLTTFNMHVRNAILMLGVDENDLTPPFIVVRPDGSCTRYTLQRQHKSKTPVLIAGWLRRKKPPATGPPLDASPTGALPGEQVPTTRHLPPQCVFQLNLQSFLNSKVVQQNATELNVRLIKWRIIPEFEPLLINNLKFVIIGMGTLGCLVCRELIGWGVKRFTLIDCGVVAPSNPARQCLYLAADVSRTPKVHVAKNRLLQIRNDLEITALNWEIPMPGQERFNLAVKNFIPDCEDEDADEIYSEWISKRLEAIFEDHDGVWLLTDNRESRWLPSLILQQMSFRSADRTFVADESVKAAITLEQSYRAEEDSAEDDDVSGKSLPEKLTNTESGDMLLEACEGRCSTNETPPPIETNRRGSPFRPPLCYTVALGFDTFVAMRHGTYSDCSVDYARRDLRGIYDVYGGRLSCYFCNDLTAPGPLSMRRALDQQCTVTRAGVGGWAAALAVEAVIAMTQAEYGWGCAPPDRIQEAKQKMRHLPTADKRHIKKWLTENPCHQSCLGDTPHVIRGSLGTFNLAHNWHPAFSQCVCCGVNVQKAFVKHKEKFVSSVIQNSGWLEAISGINQFKSQSIREDVLSYSNVVESDEDRSI